jgi:hypothetical protein
MSIAASPRGYVERAPAGELAEAVDVIVDKGMIVDGFVRVRPVGLELVTVDGRAVIAGIDTYLHFADAVNRFALSGPIDEGFARGGRG